MNIRRMANGTAQGRSIQQNYHLYNARLTKNVSVDKINLWKNQSGNSHE